jgi:hypothetical protein
MSNTPGQDSRGTAALRQAIATGSPVPTNGKQAGELNPHARVVAALRKICRHATECEMHGEPSTVEGIEWEDIVEARAALAALAKAEGKQ